MKCWYYFVSILTSHHIKSFQLVLKALIRLSYWMKIGIFPINTFYIVCFIQQLNNLSFIKLYYVFRSSKIFGVLQYNGWIEKRKFHLIEWNFRKVIFNRRMINELDFEIILLYFWTVSCSLSLASWRRVIKNFQLLLRPN